MELLIYNYTGFEREFEVSIKDKGKITFEYYVTDSDIDFSMDQEGYATAKINSIDCITYDKNDKPKAYVLNQEQIDLLEKELTEYVDWDKWIDWKSQPDDDYEQRKFNSID
jgi:hypothetical protein